MGFLTDALMEKSAEGFDRASGNKPGWPAKAVNKEGLPTSKLRRYANTFWTDPKDPKKAEILEALKSRAKRFARFGAKLPTKW